MGAPVLAHLLGTAEAHAPVGPHENAADAALEVMHNKLQKLRPKLAHNSRSHYTPDVLTRQVVGDEAGLIAPPEAPGRANASGLYFFPAPAGILGCC